MVEVESGQPLTETSRDSNSIPALSTEYSSGNNLPGGIHSLVENYLLLKERRQVKLFYCCFVELGTKAR